MSKGLVDTRSPPYKGENNERVALGEAKELSKGGTREENDISDLEKNDDDRKRHACTRKKSPRAIKGVCSDVAPKENAKEVRKKLSRFLKRKGPLGEAEKKRRSRGNKSAPRKEGIHAAIDHVKGEATGKTKREAKPERGRQLIRESGRSGRKGADE